MCDRRTLHDTIRCGHRKRGRDMGPIRQQAQVLRGAEIPTC